MLRHRINKMEVGSGRDFGSSSNSRGGKTLPSTFEEYLGKIKNKEATKGFAK